MNGLAPIRNINNSILATTHASPMPIQGTEHVIESVQYKRMTPGTISGQETVNTTLKKKFYGNSSNKTASAIAEKKRITQIGKVSNTTPCKNVDNNQAIYAQQNALRGTRNSGYVLPKKCVNTPSSINTFNGRSISVNPGNPGGHTWYNLGQKRWTKFCANNDITNVSHYYPDYVRGELGTSAPKRINNEPLYNLTSGPLASIGYAKSYTDIRNRYIFQRYNPI